MKLLGIRVIAPIIALMLISVRTYFIFGYWPAWIIANIGTLLVLLINGAVIYYYYRKSKAP